MPLLTPHELTVMFLSLGTLLASARVLGELARRFNQPVVLGELLAGILLGPTVLGHLAPGATQFLFPMEGNLPVVRRALTILAVTLFLLVAGMEVNLSTVWKQGRAALAVSISGIIVPFVLGLTTGWFAADFLGQPVHAHRGMFALFFATAMSISALPVIAKTLMDINLYRSDLGMIVIAAAIFDDLTGWIIFAVILGMMGTNDHGPAIGYTVLLTLGYTVATLTVVRWLIDRALPWIQAYSSWPGGVLGFALCLALFGAACTQWIGLHPIFGAFLIGVAIGDSQHLREQTRTIIHHFVSFIFAPLFFASIGLQVDFLAHFDWKLTGVVLTIACAGKILGCGFGARAGGFEPREAWAIGCAMNARGAMEIILGLLALQYGLIDERLFVSLVVTALVTSMASGPLLQAILQLKRPRQLSDYLSSRTFLGDLQARDREGVIQELVRSLPDLSGIGASTLEEAVLARERIMPTGIGNHVAVPHARIAGLTQPIVALGLSHDGIDFDAPDGEAAQLIFVILTPQHDDGAQVTLLADIARRFLHEETRRAALQVKSYTELLALLKTQTS